MTKNGDQLEQGCASPIGRHIPKRVDCYNLLSSNVLFFKVLSHFLIVFELQSNSMINVQNITITFLNDVIQKCTFEIETERS